MNIGVRNEINNIADLLRESLYIETPIEDMKSIVKKLKGELIYCDYIPDNADGRIKREGDRFIIEVLKMQNERRERFTIAHELGHLFLHMGYIIDDELWENSKDNDYFRKDYGEIEYQAHEFAAALLMPREEYYNEINKCYIGNGMYDMEKVSDYFGVSVEAAVNRGRWLGILAWG